MAKRNKSNKAAAASYNREMSSARRRGTGVASASQPSAPLATSNGLPSGIKKIDASSALERSAFEQHHMGKMTVSRAIAMSWVYIQGALPAIVSWGVIMALIFGGCCSNVFTLEAIVKEESESGLLITFTQFLVVTIFVMPQHVSLSRFPYFLKERKVPLMRWILNTAMFFTINMMNNYAFGFKISVPVHLILRSGGSVVTMLVGFLWGKRYTRGQVIGVLILTVGVFATALADAQAKGMLDDQSGAEDDSTTSFVTGLAILLVAQLLSAIMGVYVEVTYQIYGKHWHENLFYSHLLSLPMFIPFLPMLKTQLARLMDSPPVTFYMPNPDISSMSVSQTDSAWSQFLTSVYESKSNPLFSITIPFHVIMLAANALLQFACIRGVNLLGARTTALGVTVVLNIRKLVSLFASIWLFGNKLPVGVIIGAAIVFTGAGVYSWGGTKKRMPTIKANGKAKTK